MAVGARQSFQFFRKIAWFIGNNKALSKFRYRILHNLISITNLSKNHSIKASPNLTTRSTLSSQGNRVKGKAPLNKSYTIYIVQFTYPTIATIKYPAFNSCCKRR